MASVALQNWRTSAAAALDEIEAAHAAVGGTAPGRRYATQQINQAYAVLLSSWFQRFCRDLHTEAIDHFVGHVAATASVSHRNTVRGRFTDGRKLDSGNPTPGNLGSDFARLGITLWPDMIARDGRNAARQGRLKELNRWRNAVAHRDFDPSRLGGRTEIRLGQVRAWRATCAKLAVSMDRVVAADLTAMIGACPW